VANITSTRVKLASKFDGTEIIVSQDSIRHYTMIPKRAENFAKNITTRIRFGKENHLDEFATNCNITSSGTLPVTIWVSMNISIDVYTYQQQTYLFDFCLLPCNPGSFNSSLPNCGLANTAVNQLLTSMSTRFQQ